MKASNCNAALNVCQSRGTDFGPRMCVGERGVGVDYEVPLHLKIMIC